MTEIPFLEFEVSADLLTARVRLPHDLARRDLGIRDEPTAQKKLRAWLAERKIAFGIRDDAVSAVARRLAAPQPPDDAGSVFGRLRGIFGGKDAAPLATLGEWIDVARGSAPEPGRDGRVKYAFNTELRGGTERKDTSVDLRDRGYARNVEKGQLLASILDPERGLPGKDVFGNEVPPPEVKPAVRTAGEGVERRDERRFYATADGYARYDETTIAVDPILTVPGDVGPDTGSIDGIGDVVVKGSVTDGYDVRARGSVTVTGSIQKGARVEAGGNLSVGEGIVCGDDELRVTAGGTLRAGYIEASRISAAGDAIVRRYVSGAHVRAGGWIKLAADSEVRGSTLEARRGIVAATVGAKGETENTLVAGYLASVRTFLVEARKKIKELSEQRDAILAAFEKSSEGRPRDDPEFQAERREVGLRLDAIDSHVASLRAEVKRLGNEDLPDHPTPLIVVMGELRPKCRIDILGHHLDVLYESQFRIVHYLDPASQKLASKPLKDVDLGSALGGA